MLYEWLFWATRAILFGCLLIYQRRMAGPPLPPPSGLHGRLWEVDGVGQVAVQLPRKETLADVDRTWSALRPENHQNIHWRWEAILRGRPERLTIVDAASQIVAIWCSKKYRPLRLPEGKFYRLDYLEVHPQLRGGDLGLFALSMVAARAIELECDGLVLASLPGTKKFYEESGGEQRMPDGWEIGRGLVPFVFLRQVLEQLKEEADELIIEQ